MGLSALMRSNGRDIAHLNPFLTPIALKVAQAWVQARDKLGYEPTPTGVAKEFSPAVHVLHQRAAMLAEVAVVGIFVVSRLCEGSAAWIWPSVARDSSPLYLCMRAGPGGVRRLLCRQPHRYLSAAGIPGARSRGAGRLRIHQPCKCTTDGTSMARSSRWCTQHQAWEEGLSISENNLG